MNRPLTALLVAALALGACHSEATRKKIDALERGEEVAAASPATAPAARPVAIKTENDLIDFAYSWPAEASAVPTLDRRFRSDAAKQEAELTKGAREEKAARAEMGGEFHGHSLAISYDALGQSARLLSLARRVESFTGGAHGNRGTSALLWDRQAGREIAFADLFGSPAGARLLSDPWCAALNAERAERRGEPVTADANPFNLCPKLSEISIVPTDGDGDGRFERLQLGADPYVAGPYAEGDYRVELPVTAELVAAMKPEYRASFVARQPQ